MTAQKHSGLQPVVLQGVSALPADLKFYFIPRVSAKSKGNSVIKHSCNNAEIKLTFRGDISYHFVPFLYVSHRTHLYPFCSNVQKKMYAYKSSLELCENPFVLNIQNICIHN